VDTVGLLVKDTVNLNSVHITINSAFKSYSIVRYWSPL